MTSATLFEPCDLPPETDALRQEVRAFLAGAQQCACAWRPYRIDGKHHARAGGGSNRRIRAGGCTGSACVQSPVEALSCYRAGAVPGRMF